MLKKCGFMPDKIILYQPDEIFHHEQLGRKILVRLFNRLQQAVCRLRPALSRGLIIVAKPIK